MLDNGYGSCYGRFGRRPWKAAAIHLSRSLAMERARSGIRVNALSPGCPLTPMNRRPEVGARLAAYAEGTPLYCSVIMLDPVS